MSRSERREQLADALYRALVRYDRELRTLRDLRMISRGQGPTIKRGTKRAAMAFYLADAVLNAEEEA